MAKHLPLSDSLSQVRQSKSHKTISETILASTHALSNVIPNVFVKLGEQGEV